MKAEERKREKEILGKKWLPWGFSGGSVVKNPPANVGDMGLIPGGGRLPGEGNGNPLQFSCLGNPVDRGGRWTTFHGVTATHTT